LIDEVDVEDDIEIEVGRDGRGFEGGAEDFMDVEDDVSRNSGGGSWPSAGGPWSLREIYLWCGVNARHESGVLLVSSVSPAL